MVTKLLISSSFPTIKKNYIKNPLACQTFVQAAVECSLNPLVGTLEEQLGEGKDCPEDRPKVGRHIVAELGGNDPGMERIGGDPGSL